MRRGSRSKNGNRTEHQVPRHHHAKLHERNEGKSAIGLEKSLKL